MGRLIPNENIVKRDPSHNIYCHEPYAQELYEKYCDHFQGKTLSPKDMRNGQICRAEVMSISDKQVLVQAENSQSIYLDLLKETKFLEKSGSTTTSLKKGMVIDVCIENDKNGNYFGSMEKAFSSRVKKDLMSSLKNKDAAYKVTIKSINDGGFMVDLSGTECFMPGSLAAANKILDFESMIGKEVMVMVENYIEGTDMFVVSNKRYIQKILPDRIAELDLSKKYEGHVTGVMKYGAFIEWDEIFTGLLHESEAIDLNWSDLKPGSRIEFYIKEIKEGKEQKDLRVILTQKDPSGDIKIYQDFKDKYEGEPFANAVVKEIRNYGILFDLKGTIGFMRNNDMRKSGLKLKEGDILDVIVKSVDVYTKKVNIKPIED